MCRSYRRFNWIKIADKITSLKVKDKPQEVLEEEQEIIIPQEKRQKTISDLRLF